MILFGCLGFLINIQSAQQYMWERKKKHQNNRGTKIAWRGIKSKTQSNKLIFVSMCVCMWMSIRCWILIDLPRDMLLYHCDRSWRRFSVGPGDSHSLTYGILKWQMAYFNIPHVGDRTSAGVVRIYLLTHRTWEPLSPQFVFHACRMRNDRQNHSLTTPVGNRQIKRNSNVLFMGFEWQRLFVSWRQHLYTTFCCGQAFSCMIVTRLRSISATN